MSHLRLVTEQPIIKKEVVFVKPQPKFDRHIEKKMFKIGDRVKLDQRYIEDSTIRYVNNLKKGIKFKNNMCYIGTVVFCSFEQDKGKNYYYVNITYWIQFDNGKLFPMMAGEIISFNFKKKVS